LIFNRLRRASSVCRCPRSGRGSARLGGLRVALPFRRNALIADATLAPGSTSPVAGGLDGELKALRDKAGRICEELSTLYRRMDELQQRIQAHQQR
jgi:hypothetical protein